MDKLLNLLQEKIGIAINAFNNRDKSRPVRIISHLDADGIASAGILVKAMKRANIRYVLTIVPQLTQEFLEKLSKEDYSTYIFSDLGSGMLQSISNYLSDKLVIVLDHHEIPIKTYGENILLVNPQMFSDNYESISGAGVTYLFVKQLDNRNIDLSSLAIVGALGDIQEVEGELRGINKLILEEAVNNGYMRIEKSLKLVGITTKYLHNVIEQSRDIFIEGVTGSESGTIQFLQEIGINPMGENGWRMYHELTKEEKDRLITALLMHKPKDKDYKDLLMNRYIIPNRPLILGDARDLATALNACGRLGKASIGIAACLGVKGIEKKLVRVIREYRQAIVNSLNWVKENMNNPSSILLGKGYMIINARENILSTIIGTITSIISREYRYEIYIGMARNSEGYTKISIRQKEKKHNLRKLIEQPITELGGISGGHASAAGGLIKSDREEIFIKKMREILEKIVIEQRMEI